MPSLYVHVPFCIQKCDYCAFYSHTLKDVPGDLIALYLEGLALEVAGRRKDAPQGVSSLFIGGGTPTVLTAENLERLMILITQNFAFEERAEKTVEGNPGTLTREKITIIRKYGINRFSLGVQAFDDRLLRNVGRFHSAQQARDAVRFLREAGFSNLNLDLMFGLPGQDMISWKTSIEEALAYKPEHLSLYGLMLEEGTPLYDRFREVPENSSLIGGAEIKDEFLRKTISEKDRDLPDDDLQAEMQEWVVKRLENDGYIQYETSNFSLPGFECRHNLGYWRGKDYIGMGPGGVSCLKRVRQKNVEDVRAYYTSLFEGREPLDDDGKEVLSLKDCMAERMILGLRLREGVSFSQFREDFGVDLRDIYGNVLERYQYGDFFEINGDSLCLNSKYSFVANGILKDFV
ncbi:putative oxygen-independent coproporphyrinogen III oxidase [Desulfosporosinus acidiphilus SJ4]|uniref:Heme chaperone HemW n=1 Tax=Desulfosporosinus acidiphilus (strain DSM 22704 / JCM 16185 / SJ4) TaxID=646529 RepID=I4DAQ7_DESAJ|nr:radical SAM family heme chaperone HemW [Desulfosporosinus acidiphilus]AFM42881.1 putative oxygen-independent coproporphyrinogen III oxidase [Desulfosporosinus acidiphilus SJ4]